MTASCASVCENMSQIQLKVSLSAFFSAPEHLVYKQPPCNQQQPVYSKNKKPVTLANFIILGRKDWNKKAERMIFCKKKKAPPLLSSSVILAYSFFCHFLSFGVDPHDPFFFYFFCFWLYFYHLVLQPSQGPHKMTETRKPAEDLKQ